MANASPESEPKENRVRRLSESRKPFSDHSPSINVSSENRLVTFSQKDVRIRANSPDMWLYLGGNDFKVEVVPYDGGQWLQNKTADMHFTPLGYSNYESGKATRNLSLLVRRIDEFLQVLDFLENKNLSFEFPVNLQMPATTLRMARAAKRFGFVLPEEAENLLKKIATKESKRDIVDALLDTERFAITVNLETLKEKMASQLIRALLRRANNSEI